MSSNDANGTGSGAGDAAASARRSRGKSVRLASFLDDSNAAATASSSSSRQRLSSVGDVVSAAAGRRRRHSSMIGSNQPTMPDEEIARQLGDGEIERMLGLYRRLNDAEAFDDWMKLGIETTLSLTKDDREAAHGAAAGGSSSEEEEAEADGDDDEMSRSLQKVMRHRPLRNFVGAAGLGKDVQETLARGTFDPNVGQRSLLVDHARRERHESEEYLISKRTSDARGFKSQDADFSSGNNLSDADPQCDGAACSPRSRAFSLVPTGDVLENSRRADEAIDGGLLTEFADIKRHFNTELLVRLARADHVAPWSNFSSFVARCVVVHGLLTEQRLESIASWLVPSEFVEVLDSGVSTAAPLSGREEFLSSSFRRPVSPSAEGVAKEAKQLGAASELRRSRGFTDVAAFVEEARALLSAAEDMSSAVYAAEVVLRYTIVFVNMKHVADEAEWLAREELVALCMTLQETTNRFARTVLHLHSVIADYDTFLKDHVAVEALAMRMLDGVDAISARVMEEYEFTQWAAKAEAVRPAFDAACTDVTCFLADLDRRYVLTNKHQVRWKARLLDAAYARLHAAAETWQLVGFGYFDPLTHRRITDPADQPLGAAALGISTSIRVVDYVYRTLVEEQGPLTDVSETLYGQSNRVLGLQMAVATRYARRECGKEFDDQWGFSLPDVAGFRKGRFRTKSIASGMMGALKGFGGGGGAGSPKQ